MAIPKPPQFSLDLVSAALWVIECPDTCAQGTAFDLDRHGLVTNHHVVADSKIITAFRHTSPAEKYSARVANFSEVLDLAILEIDEQHMTKPLQTSTSEPTQMEHVAVCGFPNYRIGDSGILSPGIVVGSRMRSGVRRLLTNAGIVAGMSGGPAIGLDNRVVGICVTGADMMQNTREIEDQAIIPVQALQLL